MEGPHWLYRPPFKDALVSLSEGVYVRTVPFIGSGKDTSLAFHDPNAMFLYSKKGQSDIPSRVT